MVRTTTPVRLFLVSAVGLLLILAPATTATAATTIDGPIGLGTAESFSVLAASTVTNTGTSVLDGDVGLSPLTSVTGFPPGIVNGTTYVADETAEQAQIDLTTAYNVAAGLTPQETGLGELAGESLTPGVYSGGELALNGTLTLAGTAESVWVFQAASTLTIGSGSIITVTGGASACNVFWQVGSSATIGTGAQFVGTVMAAQSVTANTTATITGRLLARTAAVTLDTNTIIAPTGCDAAPGTVTSSPEITSDEPSAGEVGTDYTHTVTASGTPTPTFTVTSGALPAGLALDAVTGTISGEPTASGTSDFTVTASNGTAPDATADYSLVIAAAEGDTPAPAAPDATPAPGSPDDTAPGEAARLLASSGSDAGAAPLLAVSLATLGAALLLLRPLRRRAPAGAGTSR
ncbi:ice-binding family protein [Microbacterium sp. LRZ72]|uniref:ice-binding family protein n=1 Tax=Microbacterium sp. LRZ72 TaxID=2942481 RepID=UPI0029BB34AD|nr:ice-binding family protein [Microbacterium sp. LRZ72]MDX2375219.1 ice-binding family protein [Microbacterium sp. LRZ72]